jgi:hypothetical protein
LIAECSAQPIGRIHAKRLLAARKAAKASQYIGSEDLPRKLTTAASKTATQPGSGTTGSSLASTLAKAVKSKNLVITEALDNGMSEYQDDIQGQVTFGPGEGQAHSMPYHPTGNTIETLW